MLILALVLVPFPCPLPVPVTVSLFPSVVPYYPLGTTSLGRRRALGLRLLLQAPPPVYRDDAARGMTVPGILLCFFPVCVCVCVCVCIY